MTAAIKQEILNRGRNCTTKWLLVGLNFSLQDLRVDTQSLLCPFQQQSQVRFPNQQDETSDKANDCFFFGPNVLMCMCNVCVHVIIHESAKQKAPEHVKLNQRKRYKRKGGKELLGSHAYHPSIMPWLTPVKRAKESAPS